MTSEHDKRQFDAAVIGGGAAGLSAAVALGRARRSVIVLDDGTPRNAPASGVHNFLTRDGTPPAELLALGRKEAEQYGALIVPAEATAARPVEGGFEVSTADGETILARRLIVTTGLADELPDVPGVRELWGTDVVHCPYCHGWEVRDKRIGVLATGPTAVHQALLFGQLSAHVTLLRHTGPAPDGEQARQLAARGITVTEGIVEQVESDASGLTGVRLADGRHVELDAVVVAPRMQARADLLEPLGLKPAEMQIGEYTVGTYIEADPTGATAVPGVWVAGNVAALHAQVITAAAAGLTAGAAINLDLVLKAPG